VRTLAILLMCSSVCGAQVPREALPYRNDLIRESRAVWGMDAPVATFAGQIHQESRWNASAKSPVGAAGMAQFMPATASWICGFAKDLPPGCNVLNPNWAIRALVTYDKYLYDRTPKVGNTCGRMWAALRGYNGGLGHWNKEWQNAGRPSNLKLADASCGTASRAIKHCRENLTYPEKIVTRWQPLYNKAGWGAGVCDYPDVECLQ